MAVQHLLLLLLLPLLPLLLSVGYLFSSSFLTMVR